MNFKSFDYFDDEKCCNDVDIKNTKDGLIICKSCGTIYGKQFVSQERKAYTAEEVRNRSRTEPKRQMFGNRTKIFYKNTDAFDRNLNSKRRVLFTRLNKINNSICNGYERNLMVARARFSQITSILNIPKHVSDTGWRIYIEVARNKLTLGRSIVEFVCASLYVASRVYDTLLLMEEFVSSGIVSKRGLYRTIGTIVREILPGLGLKYNPIKISSLIYKFGNQLGIDVKTQSKALNLFRYAIKKKPSIRSGKDPKGFAAAVLYITVKDTKESKTQNEIASVAFITEVTLRNRIWELMSLSLGKEKQSFRNNKKYNFQNETEQVTTT